MNRFVKKHYHIISFFLLGIIFVVWVMIQGYIYPDQTELKSESEISVTNNDQNTGDNIDNADAIDPSDISDNDSDNIDETHTFNNDKNVPDKDLSNYTSVSDELQITDDTVGTTEDFTDEIPDDVEPDHLSDDAEIEAKESDMSNEPEPLDFTPKSNVVLEEGTFGAGDGKMPFDLCLANVHESLNVREAPGEGNEIIAKFLPSDYARVIEESGEWTKITSGEVTGYAHNDYLIKDDKALKKLIDSDKLLVVITERLVNLRAEKSTDADVIREAKKDETFKCIPSESDSNWFAVKNEDGNIAYVATTLAQITADMDTIDSLTPVG